MKTATIGVVAWLFAVTTASAEVQLTIQNGRVSLVAKDATVRQILAEWARVGDTKIVNIEHVPGGPVTLELTNVPEAQALDVLLRSLSGYIAAPRPVEAANLSRFDRIILMPTLAAARPPTPASSAAGVPAEPAVPAAAAGRRRRRASGAERAGRRARGQRGPVFNTFPQPQSGNPQAMPQAVPPAQPGAPPQVPNMPATSPTPVAPYGGVAVPGMVAPPPPQQPGQIPGQVPGQGPIRRPGGPGGQ